MPAARGNGPALTALRGARGPEKGGMQAVHACVIAVWPCRHHAAPIPAPGYQ